MLASTHVCFLSILTFPISAKIHPPQSIYEYDKHLFQNFIFYINLFRTYQQFDILLHVTNDTEHKTNEFLQINPTAAIIYNHDKSKMAPLQRRKYLHVVTYENPLKFSVFLQDDNVHSTDVVLFLTMPQTFELLVRRYKEMRNLSKAGRVLVINYSNLTEVYTMCFYCGPKNGFQLLYKLEQTKFLESCKRLFPENYEDFNGHQLRVVYIDYFPYIYCNKKVKHHERIICQKAVGLDYELLKTLSQARNFVFVLEEAANNSYDNLINDLVAQKYDLAIGGLNVIEERRRILQYSTVLRFDNLALVYNNPKYFSLSGSILNCWQFQTHMLFLGIITGVMFLIYFISNYCNVGSKLTLSNCGRIVQQIALDQPTNLQTINPSTTKITMSVVLITWLWGTFFVNLMLKSKLTAIMLNERRATHEVSFKNLLSEGRKVVMDQDVSETYLNIFFHEEKHWMPKSNLVKQKNICEMLRFARRENAIILSEQFRFLLHTRVACSDFYEESEQRFANYKLVPIKEAAQAWLFQSGAPYINVFNKHIRQTMSGGLGHIWKVNVVSKNKLYTISKSALTGDNPSVHFEQFFVQFVLCMLFMGAATVCFLGELAVYWWYQKV